MSIERLVVEEAKRHIRLHGWVKHMDPMSLHILKTSEHPLPKAMREWMRWKALEQVRVANREQKVLNEQLRCVPAARGASIRRCASVHPFFSAQMSRTHSATWNDKDFIGSVRESQPDMFPRREVI